MRLRVSTVAAMNDPFLDTNVLIRLLTGDDPVKQAASRKLFEKVAEGSAVLVAPDTVIADAVFVLSSPRLYRLSRAQIQDFLTPLLRLPRFQVENRNILIAALDIYVSTNLGFGDAVIVAAMRHDGATRVYSYDTDFDRFPDISRLEP